MSARASGEVKQNAKDSEILKRFYFFQPCPVGGSSMVAEMEKIFKFNEEQNKTNPGRQDRHERKTVRD